jgi:2-polyprenyl-6-methoxyphenol hydroxylase-like FAD-dependent oxidoreductase
MVVLRELNGAVERIEWCMSSFSHVLMFVRMWWSHLPLQTAPSTRGEERDEALAAVAKPYIDQMSKSYAEPVPTLLKHSGPLLYTPTYVMADLQQWYRSGVVLLGDAAHAMSSAAGQGASTALEDAAVLTRALALPQHSLDDALCLYQNARKPRVDPIVAQGCVNDKRSYTPVARWRLTRLVGNWFFSMMAGFITRQIESLYYGRPDPLDVQ